MLFGDSTDLKASDQDNVIVSIETGLQLSSIRTRLGQARFPDCDVSDPRFLIGSHIARWADNEKLRGNLGNGLCLCLIHDKAFEVGLYTRDEPLAVFVNPRERKPGSIIVKGLH